MEVELVARETMRNGKKGIIVQHRDRGIAWIAASNMAKRSGHELTDEAPLALRTRNGVKEWFFEYKG
jgi:hypothetical protein